MNWADLFGDLTIAQGLTWIAALVAFVLLVVKIWPLLASFKDFMDDVKGEAARPGVPARPGLMERISRMEDRSETTGSKVDAMSISLAQVRHEVLPNTGTSLRDAADRTERKVDTLTEDMATVHQKLDNDNRRIDELTENERRNHPKEGQ